MANLLSLRHILKVPSSVLAKNKWNLTIDLYEAIDRDFLISLASSYLVRSIDELSEREFSEERVAELKREIKRLKRQTSTAET